MELIIKMIIALALYDALGWVLVLILGIIFKDTELPKKPRKSFKERLEEKQNEYANHHGHQPTDKFDTSNPPKETGT